MSTETIAGCILGTAVGDALGLPYEGVSRDRAPRLLGRPTKDCFLFNRGMISDDTEHCRLPVAADHFLRSRASSGWRGLGCYPFDAL